MTWMTPLSQMMSAVTTVAPRTLGYDEGKTKKTFEVDADLGATHSYEK